MKAAKLLAVVCLAVSGQLATAETYNMHKLGLGYGQTVKVAFNNGQGDTLSGSYFAGQILMEFSPVVPDGYDQVFTAYCVDLLQTLATDESVTLKSTDLLNPGGNTGGGAKAAYLYNTYGSAVTDNAHAAALQLAIWEALYDGSQDLSSGWFTYSASSAGYGTVKGYADTYLLSIGNRSDEATWLYSASRQDLLTRTHDRPDTDAPAGVPEPGPMAMLLGLSVGLTVFGRRGRAKAK